MIFNKKKLEEERNNFKDDFKGTDGQESFYSIPINTFNRVISILEAEILNIKEMAETTKPEDITETLTTDYLEVYHNYIKEITNTINTLVTVKNSLRIKRVNHNSISNITVDVAQSRAHALLLLAVVCKKVDLATEFIEDAKRDVDKMHAVEQARVVTMVYEYNQGIAELKHFICIYDQALGNRLQVKYI